MYYIGLDSNSRVAAYLEAESNPNEDLWMESPWDVPPDDFDDWLYVDSELVYDPRNLPPATLSPAEVLTAIFAASPKTMQDLPDDTLYHMAPYMQPWESGIAYSIGDLREYDEFPYRCVQAHTAQADWTPDVSVSLWARVLSSPDIPEWEQPSSTNPYMKGDKVRHNGKIWVSDIDYNVFEPGVAGWMEV